MFCRLEKSAYFGDGDGVDSKPTVLTELDLD